MVVKLKYFLGIKWYTKNKFYFYFYLLLQLQYFLNYYYFEINFFF